ncbi:IS3 family transposase [Metabacillus idriensis]|uniref:IS3 family transposase n=1 Tax=Metabacillus idriensis TaxID=324768 RepID=UPI001CD1B093
MSSYWEFFFGHFKDHVNYKACDNYHQLKQEVDLFMEEYNHHRYQGGLEKKTPAQHSIPGSFTSCLSLFFIN